MKNVGTYITIFSLIFFQYESKEIDFVLHNPRIFILFNNQSNRASYIISIESEFHRTQCLFLVTWDQQRRRLNMHRAESDNFTISTLTTWRSD